MSPNPNSHFLLSGILNEPWNVHGAVHFGDIVLRRPTGIDEHVFESGLRGKIDVVLHRRIVERALSVRPDAAAPPIPRAFAGPNPTRIELGIRRWVQAFDDRRLNE